jgi:hypothetical protein
MRDKDKGVDLLPDSFESVEEAGAFWDTHSTMDYIEYLEPVDDVIEIKERVFEVQVAEDIFWQLQQEAKSLHESVPVVVDQILRKTLSVA